MPQALFASTALLPTGWAHDLRIEIDEAGQIVSLEPGGSAKGAEPVAGIVLPGMPDLHCHAFQRAMAGLAERGGRAGDDFWAWREVMYHFLERLTPDDVEAIAAQLYVELLKSGYTAVAEFHYLHNDPAGAAYADTCETAARIVSAAQASGIRLTLLPVLYQTGNFGGAPPTEGQRRFVKSLDAFLVMMERLAKDARTEKFRLGFAPHSLRAVPPDSLEMALAAVALIDPAAPIHIHAAEQEREVRDCLSWSGLPPVRWLLDHMDVDARWVLIHATHMRSDEVEGLARSGAVAGLCPTTEGNLGDGFFAFDSYRAAEGRFGIGTDSNVGLDPAEELRWLDYGQRLRREKRSLPGSEGMSSGVALWRAAAMGGAQALGENIGALEKGRLADLLVLDQEHPALMARRDDRALDSFIFGPARGAVRHVMVGGRWLIRDGHHAAEEMIAERYRRTIAALTAG